MKCVVVYARPFWRAAGWSGEVLCDEAVGPSLVFDGCDESTNHASLVIMFMGQAANIAQDAGTTWRRERVLQKLQKVDRVLLRITLIHMLLSGLGTKQRIRSAFRNIAGVKMSSVVVN